MHAGIVTVEIEYRFDAGICKLCEGKPLVNNDYCHRCGGTFKEPPSSKALMARVRERDVVGFIFGKDLIGPKIVTDIFEAKRIIRQKLLDKVSAILFVSDGVKIS
jgi:hypothetical protein